MKSWKFASRMISPAGRSRLRIDRFSVDRLPFDGMIVAAVVVLCFDVSNYVCIWGIRYAKINSSKVIYGISKRKAKVF